MGNHGKTSLISHLYPSHLLSVHTSRLCVQPRQPLGVEKGTGKVPKFLLSLFVPHKRQPARESGKKHNHCEPQIATSIHFKQTECIG